MAARDHRPQVDEDGVDADVEDGGMGVGPLSMCGSNRYRCRCDTLSLCRQFRVPGQWSGRMLDFNARVVLWPRHLYRGSDCNHP
nr:hypothetical protein BaRGS_004296 [Batillaria attramentaria]